MASDSTIIISVIGLTVSCLGLIITLVFNIINIKRMTNIQKQSLLHDMVKQEIENWKYIHEQKEKHQKISSSVKAHIFNYYEYLAYLILNNKIDEKDALNLWKPNILGMYDDFQEEFLTDRKELRKLYNKWKANEPD